MRAFNTVYGRRHTINYAILANSPDKKDIIKEISTKYDEEVIKCMELFDDKTEFVTGWLVITKSRMMFYLAQDINNFADTRKVVWNIDNKKIHKLKLKIVDTNVVSIDGKELLFSTDEYSAERISKEIRDTLRKLRIKVFIDPIKNKTPKSLSFLWKKEFWLNPWVIGIGTTVIAGLILYFILGTK